MVSNAQSSIEILKIQPIFALFGSPGVGQKVSPFDKAVTWSLLRVTSDKLITVWPMKEAMDFPVGSMP